MNRWRQKLAEINRDAAVTHTVQNVQNVQSCDATLSSVQIEQIEQSEELSRPRLATPTSFDSDISNEWSKAIVRLLSQPLPGTELAERWARACRGVEQFARGWAANAMSLGWTFGELFDFVEPFANVSLQGAVWFVGDLTVTAVTADAITLRTGGGATQRIYRNPPTQRPPL